MSDDVELPMLPWTHSHVFLGSGHESNERRTWIVIVLASVMMVAEIAGGAMFVCDADTCSTETPSSETFTTGACKTIAKKAGLLTSYGNVRSTFAADKLAVCNAANTTQVAKK